MPVYTWYVYSGGGGSPGYGSTDRDDPTQADNWTNAFVDLATADGSWGAGDTCYVAHDHANTAISANTTIAGPTTAPGVKIICVNRTTGVPVSTPSGEESQPAANTVSYSIAGYVYAWGMIFKGRSGMTVGTSAGVEQVYENCLLGSTRTTGGAHLSIGGGAVENDPLITFVNTDVRLDDSLSRISLTRGNFMWLGGALQDGTEEQSTLFGINATNAAHCFLSGVDLTHLGSNPISDGSGHIIQLDRCKGTFSLGTSDPGMRVESWGGAASTAYPYAVTAYTGAMTDETTVYRSGGASRGSSTSFCQKIITTSSCARDFAFRVKLAELDTDLSAKTLTVYAARKSAAGAALNDAECWIDVVYPDDASCQGNWATTKKGPGVTGSAYTSTSETWATLTSPYQWKMAVSIGSGAAQKGPVTVWLTVAKDLSAANAELYVCPKVAVA